MSAQSSRSSHTSAPPALSFGSISNHSDSVTFSSPGGSDQSQQVASSVNPEGLRSRTLSPRGTSKQTSISLCSAQSLGRRAHSHATSAFGNDTDPDIALPSVERDNFDTGSMPNSPNTTVNTPPPTVNGSTTECLQANELSSSLQALKLQTPMQTASSPLHDSQVGQSKGVAFNLSRPSIRSSSQEDMSTPSLHLTLAPSTDDVSQEKQPDHAHSEGITEAFDALRLRSPSLEESPARARARQGQSLTPSRRRRSSSAIDRAPHRVEDEEPSAAFSQTKEVQQAFDNARAISKNIANVLSGFELHGEPDSSIEKLYREALRLSQFELPSSRTVGLVGDSGVGKSSLVNSLLDKGDLARSVSNVGSVRSSLILPHRTTMGRHAPA